MSGEEVAKAFVQHYYQTFDGNVDQLAGLYVSLSPMLVVVVPALARTRVVHPVHTST